MKRPFPVAASSLIGDPNDHRLAPWLYTLAWSLTFAVILSHAWVADDAYITFRVVDNFVHGFGLRWNTSERVQVYTHPLWMLIHIPLYAVLGNIYLLTIGISAFCGCAAVALLLASGHTSPWRAFAFVALPLLASKTLNDFVICGLETPLTLALFAWLALVLYSGRRRIHTLYFICGLLLLTRLDTGVFVLPIVVWATFKCRSALGVGRTILAVSPIIVWCIFSLVYYGFVFPNTAYAKLYTNIARLDYVVQGLNYLLAFAYYDAFSCVLLLSAVALGLLHWRRTTSHAPALEGIVASAITIYILYVVAVGGDFMNGRFLALPVFAAVLLAYQLSCELSTHAAAIVITFGLVVKVIAATIIAPLVTESTNYNANHGIVDERAFYLDRSGLFSDPERLFRIHPKGMIQTVYSAKAQEEVFLLFGDSPEHSWLATSAIIKLDSIGFLGYYLGPRAVILDTFALSDAFLARLPVEDPTRWRIGHFKRALPLGYWQARQSGDLSAMDPDLAFYYQELDRVISAPLFDKHRIVTIIGFQLGLYDRYITR